MNLQITTTLKALDDKGGKNGFTFESYTEAIDSAIATSTTEVVNTYGVDRVQKFLFELEDTNTFNKNLLTDILNGISADNISGIHIFCYNATPTDDNNFPIQFELWSLAPSLIMKVSQMSFFNASAFTFDFVIKNITVPANKIANLSIIVTLKKP